MKRLWRWMANIALLIGVLFSTAAGLQAQDRDWDREGWRGGPEARREFREHRRDRWRERDGRHRRDRDHWRQRDRRDRNDFRRHHRERHHWRHHNRQHGRI